MTQWQILVAVDSPGRLVLSDLVSLLALRNESGTLMEENGRAFIAGDLAVVLKTESEAEIFRGRLGAFGGIARMVPFGKRLEVSTAFPQELRTCVAIEGTRNLSLGPNTLMGFVNSWRTPKLSIADAKGFLSGGTSMEIPTEQCALMRRVLARFDVTLVAVSLGHVMHLNDLIVPPTQRTRNHKERPGRLSQAAAWPTAGSAHNMSSIHGNTDGAVREVQPPPAQELQLLLSRLTQLLASNLDKQLEQESRRVRLLMALVKMVGLTDDPEEMLRQLELLTPNGDTDIQKWLDGDGSRWVRRPSGTAGLWLDV